MRPPSTTRTTLCITFLPLSLSLSCLDPVRRTLPAAPVRRNASRTGIARLVDRRNEARQSEAPPTAAARTPGGNVAARVLIGRDLSPTGMRVECAVDLVSGDEFDLVLHGGASGSAISVRAVVERVDDAGCFLRFTEVATDAAEAIEGLVDNLLVAQPARRPSSRAVDVVITEIQPRALAR